MLQRIAGFAFLPLFVMGFVEMVLRWYQAAPRTGRRARLTRRWRSCYARCRFLGSMAPLTVKLWCLYYHHSLETWVSGIRHVDERGLRDAGGERL